MARFPGWDVGWLDGEFWAHWGFNFFLPRLTLGPVLFQMWGPHRGSARCLTGFGVGVGMGVRVGVGG